MGDLRKLARRLYDLTRQQVWVGGKGPGRPWPDGLEDVDWGYSVTWTLSPEVMPSILSPPW